MNGTNGDFARQLQRLEARARHEPRAHHRPAEKLEPLRRLLAALGHPERGPRTVHVAGTNGKGTTSAMIARLLQVRGARVGLYTSPHLVDIRERIRIDGVPIGHAAFASATGQVLDAAERLPDGDALAYFDLLTAIGFTAFRAAGGLDAWVLETGLGGLADSTNICTKALAVLTPIGHDHLGILGGTLREIATQKLGIVPPAVPAVLAPQAAELEEWMAERLRAQGSAVWPARRIEVTCPDQSGQATCGVRVSWPGSEPVRVTRPVRTVNAAHLSCAATALTALDALEGPPTDGEERMRRAHAALETTVPARQQWVEGATLAAAGAGAVGRADVAPVRLPSLLIDGAHNREALGALGDSLDRLGVRGYMLIVTLLEDKLIDPVEAPLRRLLAGAGMVIAVTLNFPRSPAPERLCGFLQRLAPPSCVVRIATLELALTLAAERLERPAVIAGSLWMAGEVLKRIRYPGDRPAHAGALPEAMPPRGDPLPNLPRTP